MPEGSDGAGAVRRHGPSRRSATQVNGVDVLRVTPGARPLARRGHPAKRHSSPSVLWPDCTPSCSRSRQGMTAFREVRAGAPPVLTLPARAGPVVARPGRVLPAGLRPSGVRMLDSRSPARVRPGAVPAAPAERGRRRRREGTAVSVGSESGCGAAVSRPTAPSASAGATEPSAWAAGPSARVSGPATHAPDTSEPSAVSRPLPSRSARRQLRIDSGSRPSLQAWCRRRAKR